MDDFTIAFADAGLDDEDPDANPSRVKAAWSFCQFSDASFLRASAAWDGTG